MSLLKYNDFSLITKAMQDQVGEEDLAGLKELLPRLENELQTKRATYKDVETVKGSPATKKAQETFNEVVKMLEGYVTAVKRFV